MPNGNGARSAGEIVEDVLRDVREIVRGEVRLARAEMMEKVRRSGLAGAYLGGAAVVGLLSAGCFAAMCIALLALVMPVWLAALVMWVLFMCAAGAAFYMGREKLKNIEPVPQRTVQTVKDNLQWAKQRMT